MKVLAAMSGGVDSAVAAARMVAAGHDVTGVHLALNRNPQSYRSGARGCCSLEDSHEARRAADRLDIPFYVWDLSEEFQRDVVDDFLGEYQAGRTPNPCLRCNEKIKFAAVLNRGIALGFDVIATGHYARLEWGSDEVSLHRAADSAKDQSYVLGVLNQEQLARCVFPIADTTKPQIRREADQLGLSVAAKPDSHDICFIPDGDTAGYLQRALGPAEGEIVDTAGQAVGRHDGAHQFTIGQRRGLGLSVPAPDHQPRYVLKIEPDRRRVTVGSKADLRVKTLRGIRVSWTQGPVEGPWRGDVQVRAHGAALRATIATDADELVVELDEPVTGVAPGQSVVTYDGSRVVGAATISQAQ